MQELLEELFLLDFRLLVKKESFNHARITVVDNKTNMSASQLLPIDHHLHDANFKECVRFCKNKLIERVKK
jgi:hypothetical protein